MDKGSPTIDSPVTLEAIKAQLEQIAARVSEIESQKVVADIEWRVYVMKVPRTMTYKLAGIKDAEAMARKLGNYYDVDIEQYSLDGGVTWVDKPNRATMPRIEDEQTES